jgi:hypothetical protein
MLLRAKIAVCGLDPPKRRPAGWTLPPYRLAFVPQELAATFSEPVSAEFIADLAKHDAATAQRP